MGQLGHSDRQSASSGIPPSITPDRISGTRRGVGLAGEALDDAHFAVEVFALPIDDGELLVVPRGDSAFFVSTSTAELPDACHRLLDFQVPPGHGTKEFARAAPAPRPNRDPARTTTSLRRSASGATVPKSSACTPHADMPGGSCNLPGFLYYIMFVWRSIARPDAMVSTTVTYDMPSSRPSSWSTSILMPIHPSFWPSGQTGRAT